MMISVRLGVGDCVALGSRALPSRAPGDGARAADGSRERELAAVLRILSVTTAGAASRAQARARSQARSGLGSRALQVRARPPAGSGSQAWVRSLRPAKSR